MEHKIDAGTNSKRIGTKIGGLGNKRTNGDQPNYGIIKIGLNTEEIPKDLRKLKLR